MDINYKVSFKIFGSILCILGFSMLLPAVTAIIYGEKESLISFSIVSLASMVLGFLFMRIKNIKNNRLKMRDGAFIVSSSWILCAAIGCMPFVISGDIPNVIDAFFETSSGLSTTGATILKDIEALPKAMLLWRAFTHWLGGMGILVFTMALLPAIGVEGQQIAAAEVPGLTLSKIVPKLSDTSRYLYILYTVFTGIETILLMFGGMDFFDALCHSFSTLGTGGFSNYNASVAHFDSSYIDFVITIFMIIAGMNFNLFFIAFKNGPKTFYKDAEWRFYIFIIFSTTAVISTYLYLNGTYDSIFTSIRYAAFQDASIISTTGFGTYDYTLWPTFCQMLLFMLFFIGGSSSSTSGGIKVIRILVLLKIIKRSIVMRLHPNVIMKVKINNQQLTNDIISNISSFIFAFLGLGMLGTFILSFDGYSFITNVSASFSCLGNIGPGFAQLGPTENFSIFSNFSKLAMSFMMIAGRLEVFTLLMIFKRKFWNHNH